MNDFSKIKKLPSAIGMKTTKLPWYPILIDDCPMVGRTHAQIH
jgi:hypothetical protein